MARASHGSRRRRAAVRVAAALWAGRKRLEMAGVLVGQKSSAGRSLYSQGEAVGLGGTRRRPASGAAALMASRRGGASGEAHSGDVMARAAVASSGG